MARREQDGETTIHNEDYEATLAYKPEAQKHILCPPSEDDKMLNTETLAYHEAAHAVIAIRLLKRVEYVTIEPSGENGDIWGHASIPFDEGDDPGLVEVIDQVMVNFAGQVAEDIITGANYRDSQIHSDADRENIATFVQFCMKDQSEIDLFLAWTYERTKLYLINSWSWVEAVAKELLAKKTISGEEVQEICFKTDLALRHDG